MITSMCNSYEHTIVITNRHLVQGDFLKQLEKVTKLHPHALILREKDLTDDAYESLAKKVFDLCKREDITFFLHTKIEIARKIGCQNIHLSIPVLKGLSETEKKALTEDFCEISISCHSMEDVEIAMVGGATQIILGTIFETECKKGVLGKGVEFVREICQKCPLPVYAIGGMNLQRLPLVIDAGAAGCCMMSGFMQTTKTLQ
ncbi:thiamine phosphate synthase [Anthropogastromicrobium aceti]|uniref:thiamine phosphate synthase n=1 Tax=Anthropogastromicrobium aceti TaxID=2981768 RepID=UPI000820429B|nr:thiamine phosphate synthase [Anthropogastromicrobium aceti]MCU6784403.1 thiamine phosphate synthase [Anthropogastromicrobium aceti]SCJ65958.1 Regulatory protein tenI [uncultured Lachnospira sp.]